MHWINVYMPFAPHGVLNLPPLVCLSGFLHYRPRQPRQTHRQRNQQVGNTLTRRIQTAWNCTPRTCHHLCLWNALILDPGWKLITGSPCICALGYTGLPSTVLIVLQGVCGQGKLTLCHTIELTVLKPSNCEYHMLFSAICLHCWLHRSWHDNT